MHFSTVFAATALCSTAFAADHIVAVGNKQGELVFEPDNVQAAEGDTVTFKFWPKNHSVAQAAFASPCQPLANGFWSGYVATSDTSAAASTTFQYNVTNASAPIWFYCTQGQHCQGGMVGAINAPTSGQRTIDAFKQAASNADNNTAPSIRSGSGGTLQNSSSSGSPTSSGASPSSTGAAAALSGNIVFAGAMGAFAYLLM